MAENSSLAELFRISQDNTLAKIHKAFPGKVTAYDAQTQTAHVQPQLKRMILDEDGGKTYESLPLLPYVPVLFPRAGGYTMTLPLGPGDFVWVMISDAGLSEWLETGQESEPWDTRRHHPSGAVCYPGCYPDTQPLADADTGGLMLGKDGAETQIRISPSEIKLGATAAQFVALANLVQTALDDIRAFINTHTHLTAGTGSPVPPAPLLGVLGPVAASVVKAK